MYHQAIIKPKKLKSYKKLSEFSHVKLRHSEIAILILRGNLQGLSARAIAYTHLSSKDDPDEMLQTSIKNKIYRFFFLLN